MIERVRINAYQRGLLFDNGELRGYLGPGTHWITGLRNRRNVLVADEMDPWLRDERLRAIVRAEATQPLLESGELAVVDLRDNQRALVWVDGRFEKVLTPGLYALWNTVREVRVEIVETTATRFEHPALPEILASGGLFGAPTGLEVFDVNEGHEGLFLLNGQLREVLRPGRYAFWRNTGNLRLVQKDTREVTLDVNGQEIMSADKVTLRINAVVTYRIRDVLRTLTTSGDSTQALYREAQFALRALIGARELDAILAEKDRLTQEAEAALRDRAEQLGLEIRGFGIRDIVLPGEIRALFNRVTEARKAAEANLIARREEVAAIRSQANTARLLADNPMLLRLRELEVLERISASAELKFVVGGEKLSESVINLV